MDNKIIVNQDKIFKVIFYPKKMQIFWKSYRVIKKRNFWGCHVGYIRCFPSTWGLSDGGFLNFSDALKLGQIINGVLYDMPQVIFKFVDGSENIITFNTQEKALEYIDNLKSELKINIIEI